LNDKIKEKITFSIRDLLLLRMKNFKETIDDPMPYSATNIPFYDILFKNLFQPFDTNKFEGEDKEWKVRLLNDFFGYDIKVTDKLCKDDIP